LRDILAILLEVIVIQNVLRVAHELKTRMVPTVVTRWKVFIEHARNFVHVVVHGVVGDSVDSGGRYFVPRLVDRTLDFRDSGHSGLLWKSGEPD
jgi:hypothetical protein